MPRPPTCSCDACEKCRHRARARAAYQAMSPEERRALVARRSPALVRAADRRKYERHREKIDARTRAYARAHPDRVRAYHENWQARHPERLAAARAVGNAVQSGRLIPQPCETCGVSPAEAHHDDYTKQLGVRWLCTRHHRRADRERRAREAGPLERAS